MDPLHDEPLTVTDWEAAMGSGWRVDSAAGRWQVCDGVLRLEVDDGDQDHCLELSWPGDIGIEGDFALELDLRFLAMGLVDNSTEEASQLTIELGVARQGLGMRVLLVGDRYMVDVDRSPLQYAIFRTPENEWHRWRFEVRATRQELTLVRDGEYFYLHRLCGERPAGLRFQVRGTQQVPTKVQLGEVRVLPLQPALAEEQPAPRPVETIAAGEWPAFRRDRIQSGHSPLVGALGERPPAIAWAYRLGGYEADVAVLDIDGDGHEEIVLALRGRLAAYRFDGEPLWQAPADAPMIYGTWDVDEDGRVELVVLSGTPRQLRVLDGASGQTRYVSSYDPEYGVAGLRVAKLDPDRHGLQIVVWSRHEIGYCLGFEEGAESGQVLWTFDYQHFNFVPEIVLADMDRDGLLEVVLATYCHFLVYDGRTGAVKMSLEARLGRNYGLLIAEDVDGDGYPDIVMLAEQLREHVGVAHNEAGRGLRLLWDRFYEQNYPVDRIELRTLPGSVRDWDGDGRTEILYGLYDGTRGDIWRTLLVDALTGQAKVSLDGTYPVTLGTLADGTSVAYLAPIGGRGQRRELDAGAVTAFEHRIEKPLQAVSFDGGLANVLAELPQGSPLLDRSWRGFARNEWAMYMDARVPRQRRGAHGLYLVDAHDDADRPALVRHVEVSGDGTVRETWRCALPFDLPHGRIVDVRQDSRGETRLFYAGLDARLYILQEDGRVLQALPAGGAIGSPIVADLEPGARRVLVGNGRGQLLCLAPGDDGAVSPVWEVPAIGAGQPWLAEQGAGAPAAVDWNQDGRKEVLLGQPPRKLSLLDGRGRVQWQCELPHKPGHWTYGNFTGRPTFDLFVAYFDSALGEGCSVLCPNGQEDSCVWQRPCGAYAPAVWDADGDGRDDIVTRDLFWRRILDGAHGRDVFPVTQWCGYHLPTVVRHPQFPGGALVLWSGGDYSLVVETLDGDQVWWRPFMSDRHPGAVADVDGDGRLELGAPTWGQVYHWPAPFDPLPGLGRALACLDLATGEVKWTYDPGVAMSGVVTADINGDGRPEFLFGTADGRLIALRGGGEGSRVVFSVQLPAALGTPIVCDPTGGEDLHILVGCADGMLYALK